MSYETAQLETLHVAALSKVADDIIIFIFIHHSR